MVKGLILRPINISLMINQIDIINMDYTSLRWMAGVNEVEKATEKKGK